METFRLGLTQLQACRGWVLSDLGHSWAYAAIMKADKVPGVPGLLLIWLQSADLLGVAGQQLRLHYNG